MDGASIETSIDYENSLAIHTIKGQVTADQISRKIEEYHSGEPAMLAIYDFSEADLTKLSTEDIQSILAVGKRYAERRKGGKTALVVPDDLSFGMGRMWEVLTELESVAVENKAFRSMEQAKNWLGIA